MLEAIAENSKAGINKALSNDETKHLVVDWK